MNIQDLPSTFSEFSDEFHHDQRAVSELLNGENPEGETNGARAVRRAIERVGADIETDAANRALKGKKFRF